MNNKGRRRLGSLDTWIENNPKADFPLGAENGRRRRPFLAEMGPKMSPKMDPKMDPIIDPKMDQAPRPGLGRTAKCME